MITFLVEYLYTIATLHYTFGKHFFKINYSSLLTTLCVSVYDAGNFQ